MAKKNDANPLKDALAEITREMAALTKRGPVQYLKSGDTTVKLVLPPGRGVRNFYQTYVNTFKGEPFPYFLVAGVIVEADEDGVADDTKVRYIKVTKTIVLEIVNLLGKRWDLFADNGPLITITQGKKQGKAVYSVAPLADSFDATGLPFPDVTIEAAAAEQEKASAEYDANGGKGKREPADDDLPF